jgi:hypothetical protein
MEFQQNRLELGFMARKARTGESVRPSVTLAIARHFGTLGTTIALPRAFRGSGRTDEAAPRVQTYTRGVQRKLILRNAACLAAVKPSDFDVDGFAENLDLGPSGEQLRLGDIAVMEWAKVRLQVLPDRLQLGFKEDADADIMRKATEKFFARIDGLAPDANLTFNAALQLTLEEGDPDPSEKLVNAGALATSLGGRDGRGGITLVYHDDLSRWWIELSPQPDDVLQWIFDFNRKFDKVPASGEDRDAVLDWFVGIEARLVAQFEAISSGTDQ